MAGETVQAPRCRQDGVGEVSAADTVPTPALVYNHFA